MQKRLRRGEIITLISVFPGSRSALNTYNESQINLLSATLLPFCCAESIITVPSLSTASMETGMKLTLRVQQNTPKAGLRQSNYITVWTQEGRPAWIMKSNHFQVETGNFPWSDLCKVYSKLFFCFKTKTKGQYSLPNEHFLWKMGQFARLFIMNFQR